MTKAPGKHWRKGLSLVGLMEKFNNDDAAAQWFASQRWPNGPTCPYCGSCNVQEGIKHRSMTHRCRDCPDRRMFSLKTGTIMRGSPLGYRVWAIAIYLLVTNLKSVSSMKLHRELEISQKSAWYLAHRIREAWKEDRRGMLVGAGVEVDETYIGGKRKNMPKSRRKLMKGRGPAGKTAVVGAKDRSNNRVVARSVESTDGATLRGFVNENVAQSSKVFTDEAPAYRTLPHSHEAVNHSVGEYVRDQAHTNGIESFWSMLKRGYHGTFHHFSEKHTDRYVMEFAGRHNARNADTIAIMGYVAKNMVRRRLMYRDLVAN